ncbi:MAG: response regulator [Pyrinomonadaceae bacterium MAG19_C2-C3]|nr:response regulator [Pyrinomonadaceae bacterium MAG19_C2-C3]
MQSPKRKSRVLVAEDNEELSALMEARFRTVAFEASFADDGEMALRMIRASRAAGHPYDLLVLDGAMPILDGFSVLRAVRDEDGDTETPIIIFTGYSNEPIAQMSAQMYGAVLVPKERIWTLAECIEKKLSGEPSDCSEFEDERFRDMGRSYP